MVRHHLVLLLVIVYTMMMVGVFRHHADGGIIIDAAVAALGIAHPFFGMRFIVIMPKGSLLHPLSTAAKKKFFFSVVRGS